jgi:Sulfotransferase family
VAKPKPPPLLVLGVRRSGTTLLRVMLDRNPVLAVPDESYFIPTLARRHGNRPDPDAFVDDLRRLRTLREWGLEPSEVRERLHAGMTLGEAVSAIYESYAAKHGKERWGDKTPMYMQHLGLLERLFPSARFVHLIRDGRDAAVSFLAMPEGVATRTWAHPDSPAGFACQWREEVEAARTLGRRVGERYLELRYEALVGDAAGELRRVCDFAGLPWDPGMLDYAGKVDLSGKPHQQSLARPPTPGLRDWRRELPDRDRAEFEAIAGDLLAELGYEVMRTSGGLRARLRRAAYAARSGAWRASAAAVQRSPLWRRRHPPLV